jgi:phosphomannomutase
VNVVDAMRSTDAVIGGEGNGGIIYPTSHCGRDAIVGTALFLTHLVEKNMKASELRSQYPHWVMSKDKLELPEANVSEALEMLVAAHPEAEVNTVDGVKFDLREGWVHLRQSNTEAIIRVYSEAKNEEEAKRLGQKFKEELMNILSLNA